MSEVSASNTASAASSGSVMDLPTSASIDSVSTRYWAKKLCSQWKNSFLFVTGHGDTE